MLRTVLRDIHSYCASSVLAIFMSVRGGRDSFRRRAMIRQWSAMRHLWWLSVLPGLAVAQSQCTLYQAAQLQQQGDPGPGPLEPSLAAAEADAYSLELSNVPLQVPGAIITFGFQFACGTNQSGSIPCYLTYGATFSAGNTAPPPGILQETSIIKSTGTCPQPQYWLVAPATPQGEVCTANCVGDPINPALGTVYKREEDDVRVSGASPIRFQRFYDSADKTGADMGPGWRHTYTRSISVNYQATHPAAYPGQSAMVSAQYPDPSTACAQRTTRCAVE